MDLKDYLAVTRQSLRSFARTCQVSPATMMRVSRKSVVPSRKLMERIYKETGHLVAPCDLIGMRCRPDQSQFNQVHNRDAEASCMQKQSREERHE